MTTPIDIVKLNSTKSTNDYLRSCKLSKQETQGGFLVVATEEQTAGRGSGENTWESAPGKNITFSIRCHPTHILPSQQYILSMGIAIAIRRTISKCLPNENVTIKWPNDIYINNEKVCGILIECKLHGKVISECIIGVGLNVNQHQFSPELPNATSISLYSHKEHDRDFLLQNILIEFLEQYKTIKEKKYDLIRQEYHNHLYRSKNLWKFEDLNKQFTASIVGVEDDGHLVLKHTNGEIVKYDFHTVKFII